jgi:ATP-binding cassette, subfamily G (WHITE), member 2, SNQ2
LLDIFTQRYLTPFRYQAGEGIYDLFDKVMIIDEGRQIFLGSPSAARAYFEDLGYKSLPRQSTPDYLTGCTDPNERQFAPGRSARDTPSTPEALENAYLLSTFARDNDDSRTKYNILMETEKADQEAFRAAVAADKKKGVSVKSPYTLGFTGQVRALVVRQFQMRVQDRFQLYTSFSLTIVRIFVSYHLVLA